MCSSWAMSDTRGPGEEWPQVCYAVHLAPFAMRFTPHPMDGGEDMKETSLLEKSNVPTQTTKAR
jgi:hypothetical protein